MAVSFRKLFNLYVGEEKSAILFTILAFLWAFGAFCGLTLSEGLFLEHLGAKQLPQAYLIIAGIMLFLASLFLLALNKISVSNFFLTILTLGILFYLFFLICIGTERSWIWFGFRVFGSIFATVIATCYWAFVDQYFAIQDAKRLFCLFNSAAFLGDACAGALIACGLEFLNVSGILAIIVILLSSTIPLIYYIIRKIKPILDDSVESIQSIEKKSIKKLGKAIVKSPFTLYLMLSYFLFQVLAIVTEYSYMDAFELFFNNKTEKRDPNQLTQFLGSCNGWVSLGNILFGLLGYSRLVKKIGINQIVLISPIFFLIIFLFWPFNDLLLIAVLGLIAKEGMVCSFDDNNFNLLINGVPLKAKNQIRIAVESFFEPAGMLISAFILLFARQESKIIGLFLALLAISAVFILRSHYSRAIFFNLYENALQFGIKSKEWLYKLTKKEKKESEFVLFKYLKHHDESTQLLAYESLLKLEDPKILTRLLNQTNRLSIPGKIKIIELLSESAFSREHQVINRLETWRRMIPHPKLRSMIHFYLAKQNLLHPDRVIVDLESKHIGLKGAAIFTLKKHDFQSLSSYSLLASNHLKQLLQSESIEELSMGIKILGLEEKAANMELLIPFLKHPNIEIAKQTAFCIAQVASSSCSYYVQNILEHLSPSTHSEIRFYCLEALNKIGDSSAVNAIIRASLFFRPHERKLAEDLILKMGLCTVPLLVNILKDNQIADKSRLLSGKILGKIALPQLKNNLFDLIQKESERAYFYFFHYQTIQSQSDHDLSLLENALLTGYHSIIDFMIQILAIAGSIEDSELISHSLKSKNLKIYGHALETLQEMCEPKIFALLQPLIDDRPVEEKLRYFLKNGNLPLNLHQLLDEMQCSSSQTDQMIAITLKARFNYPHWRACLRKQMAAQEEIFHEFAFELLES